MRTDEGELSMKSDYPSAQAKATLSAILPDFDTGKTGIDQDQHLFEAIISAGNTLGSTG